MNFSFRSNVSKKGVLLMKSFATAFLCLTILCLSFDVYSQTDSQRPETVSVLDVDASGDVDALTDGLLLLRSMFGLTDETLVTGVVSSQCVDCEPEKIEQYLSTVSSKTYADLNSTDDQNIAGSSLDGTTLTIGIEGGDSETVDLSSLEDGVGITSDQASAITANTAKTGITSDQASAITANTEKVGTDDQDISGLTLNGTTLTVGIERGDSDSIDLAALVNCSATQDGSRVIINCNDGTSGILASAGTVITYPEGQSPPVDIDEFPTGTIVVKDAAGVILGEYWWVASEGYYTKLPPVPQLVGYAANVNVFLTNDDENQVVIPYPRSGEVLWYNDIDCSGTIFITNNAHHINFGPNNTYFVAASSTSYPQLMKSKYDPSQELCINEETAFSDYAFPAARYYFADEIINATYPISLDQLQ